MTGTQPRAQTVSVRARDGFESWAGMVGDLVMPVSITSPHVERFRGTATALDLTHTDLSGFAFSPMSARRGAGHIRRGDPENYFLFLVHGSPVGLEQNRSNALLRAGDMALFDSSHPLSCEFLDKGRLSRISLLRVRRSVLPLPQDHADQLLGTRLATGTASGALLASYLTGLRTHTERADPTELSRLGSVGLDLCAAYLAVQSGSPGTLPPETRRQVLLARIRAFIDHNLPDPRLGPDTIAAHHHISVRLLHSLFRAEPETVAATIRRLRLEHSRTDLADPRLVHSKIGEIAARWGFRHPADFSRAFRRAYGMPPSDYRRLTLLRDARQTEGPVATQLRYRTVEPSVQPSA
ncbi:helix-turn-helix domain-containing protein [Streptomyces lavendulae]|uniref:helix-turn-helix domain-containing protein n=1 Tax=Streptomyces lavendulae TaxID=1914 RepID=UPI001F2750A9|nr:helix-turn-helix domain-containing protein [Streptomyces lavendulae]